MKIVERLSYDKFRFKCPVCKVTLEAGGKEFEYLKPGRLACTCPSCNERIVIRQHSIKNVPVYQEAKKN